jgi:outer membrane receptor protein involved in Fe transport
LTWHPNKDATLYASYAQGFRSGLFQVPTVAVLGYPTVKPDTLNNYELGAKAGVLDGRIVFDAAVYYMDWRDVQRQVGVTFDNVGFTGLINGTSASGVGVDFGLTARVMDGLELGAYISWNNLTSDGTVYSSGIPLFNKGDRLDNSPEYTAGASGDYIFPVGDAGLKGRLSASVNYTSKQTVRDLNGDGTGVEVDDGAPMLLSRASFALEAPRGWSASLYVENLGNETRSPLPSTGNPGASIQIRPRTYGLQLEYHY